MITTVVGNYPKIPNQPRPARLRKAIADWEARRITLDELHQVEDAVTDEVIAEQIAAGIDLITDGKIRWEDDQTYFARKLSGFSIDGLVRYFDSNTYHRQPVCEGAVGWTEPITVQDYAFAAARSGRPVKPVLTGPYTLARLSDNRFYPSLEPLVLALSEALNKEAHALEAAGASFIQFDEPALLRHKEDWPLFEQAVDRLTSGLTAKLALYTYFGSVAGLYPQILSLPFAVIGLDFVQGAVNWDVLSAAPFTKELGFGIVDARNTRIESRAELHRAFDRIARLVPLDRVYVNPSCGLEFLPRERAQVKLINMVAAVRSYKLAEEARASKMKTAHTASRARGTAARAVGRVARLHPPRASRASPGSRRSARSSR